MWARAMSAPPSRRRFPVISRELAFWILAAVAMIVVGIILDILWGNF